MKKLDINFNIEVPDDYDPQRAVDLAYFLVDSSYEILTELNYKLVNYEICEYSQKKFVKFN